METDIVWNNFLPVMYTLPYMGKEFYPQKHAKANRRLNDSVRQFYKNTYIIFICHLIERSLRSTSHHPTIHGSKDSVWHQEEISLKP